MTAEQTNREVGLDAREVIKSRLKEIAAVEAGNLALSDTLVTTTKGMVPLMPANAEFIRNDLQEVWGKTYPELFDSKIVRFITVLSKLSMYKYKRGRN